MQGLSVAFFKNMKIHVVENEKWFSNVKQDRTFYSTSFENVVVLSSVMKGTHSILKISL